jgi:hypothetical protein
METHQGKADAATHRRKALKKETPLQITIKFNPKTSSFIL